MFDRYTVESLAEDRIVLSLRAIDDLVRVLAKSTGLQSSRGGSSSGSGGDGASGAGGASSSHSSFDVSPFDVHVKLSKRGDQPVLSFHCRNQVGSRFVPTSLLHI